MKDFRYLRKVTGGAVIAGIGQDHPRNWGMFGQRLMDCCNTDGAAKAQIFVNLWSDENRFDTPQTQGAKNSPMTVNRHQQLSARGTTAQNSTVNAGGGADDQNCRFITMIDGHQFCWAWAMIPWASWRLSAPGISVIS